MTFIRMRVVAAAALAALVLSCAMTGDTEPLGYAGAVGTEADQKAFSGLWRGTLEAADPSVSGPIQFRLEPGAALFEQLARTPRKVEWVKFSGGKMAGATDTWFDADRKADVYTMFEATLAHGVMHGIVRENVGGKWTELARFTATRISD